MIHRITASGHSKGTLRNFRLRTSAPYSGRGAATGGPPSILATTKAYSEPCSLLVIFPTMEFGYIETITLSVKQNMVIQMPQADPSRTITSLSRGARPGVSAKLVSAPEVQARVYYYGAFLGSQRKGINGRGILPVVAHPRELNIPNTLRFLPLSRY